MNILRTLSNPNSTFSDFNTGNTETLWEIPKINGIDISKELRKFYDKYYSSNLMKLVIIGNATVSELEELAYQKFSDVPLKYVIPPKCEYPYEGVQLPLEIRFDPVFNDHIMTLAFPLQIDIRQSVESQPLKYLSMLISYRGDQGLTQNLKRLGYVLDIDIGYSSLK